MRHDLPDGDWELSLAFDKWLTGLFNAGGLFRRSAPFSSRVEWNAFGEATIDHGRMVLRVPDDIQPYTLISIQEGQNIIVAMDVSLAVILMAGLQHALAREFANTFKG